MSSRRLARAKLNPKFDIRPDADPARCYAQVIEHRRLGRVVIRRLGAKISRIRTQYPPFPPSSQNYFGPTSSGGTFEQVLDMLNLR